jgi:heptosyltransferase-2
VVRAPNWLGDAVMSLPVLAGLKRLYSQAAITVLAIAGLAPLFHAAPGVDQVLVYPRDQGKWRFLWGQRGRFDLAVALPNSLESALGLWVTGAPARLGYVADLRRPWLSLALYGRRHLQDVHLVYYYLGLLTALGEVTSFTPPGLGVSKEESDAAQARLAAGGLASNGPWVGLSPGAAYGPAKRWPPERFAGLAAGLEQEFGAGLVLLGGPDDRPVADELKNHFPGPVLDLVGQTDLRQALGVLSQLRLLITNDSGLMHAAGALGVPLVALFGSTDPQATGPFTDRATVLYHPWPCSPCLKRTCPTDYECLTAISVAEVMAAARNWLTET